MHVSSSQSNTATQTDDKTHTERTAAAARILVVCSQGPINASALRIELVGPSVRPMTKTHYTLDNKYCWLLCYQIMSDQFCHTARRKLVKSVCSVTMLNCSADKGLEAIPQSSSSANLVLERKLAR